MSPRRSSWARNTTSTSRPPSDEPADDWPDAPTVSDDQSDTAPHDLSGVARALAAPADAEGVLRLAFDEGAEEAVRALYVVMRRKGLTRGEMDAIVLAVRAEIVRL